MFALLQVEKHILRMGSRRLWVICLIYGIRSILCIESSVKFVSVDFLEGYISNQHTTSTVQECVAVCARHVHSCFASIYDVDSKECQLSDKWSGAPTTRFSQDGEWRLLAKVRKRFSLNYDFKCPKYFSKTLMPWTTTTTLTLCAVKRDNVFYNAKYGLIPRSNI